MKRHVDSMFNFIFYRLWKPLVKHLQAKNDVKVVILKLKALYLMSTTEAMTHAT